LAGDVGTGLNIGDRVVFDDNIPVFERRPPSSVDNSHVCEDNPGRVDRYVFPDSRFESLWALAEERQTDDKRK
jgi:hypothetical protein